MPPDGDLGILLGDLAPEAFFATAWDRAWARLPGPPDRLAAVFDPAALGSVVLGDLAGGTTPARPHLRIDVTDRDGAERTLHAPLEMARPLFGAGMRVTLVGLEAVHPPLAALAAAAGALFGAAPPRVDAVLVPEGAEVPWSTAAGHELVLQAEGACRWSIGDRDELELPVGDGLYLPPGVRRRVHATARSCHLRLATPRLAFADLVAGALDGACRDDVRHHADPIAFLAARLDEARARLAALTPEDLRARLAQPPDR